MHQITQHRRTGAIRVRELPAPGLRGLGAVVANRVSLISAGTERHMMEFGAKSLIGKARSRPDLVKQVLARAKREGMLNAWRVAGAQLDAEIGMGYSSAGDVLVASEGVEDLKPGDRVACAGSGYASHAGVVYVPHMLTARIPDGVSYDEAAFVTLGSIAMQGVRQTEVRLGERVCVVGLGLLGLLTVQLLRAAGCQVLGTDLEPGRLALAKELGATVVASREQVVGKAMSLSAGRGVDAVIITAATQSNDPIEVAGEISRLKGRVVVVGLVGLEVPREMFYRRELDLRFSLSYGPGRHDPSYEERGQDYPFSYVRFTIKRNMETFLELVKEKVVDVRRLITHRLPIEKGEDAYRLVSGKDNEAAIGVMLEYPVGGPRGFRQSRSVRGGVKRRKDELGVAVIGAGQLSKVALFPALTKQKDVRRVTVIDIVPGVAAKAAEDFGFEQFGSETEEVLANLDVDAIFIATRHGSHAELVEKAIRAGKHVFVEKPLGVNWQQLSTIARAAEERPELICQVGYNRRFAQLTMEAKNFFNGRSRPLMISYLVNAGWVPKEHWIYDPVEGGGRIIGEACHFIDLGLHLAGAWPVRVTAASACGRRSDYVDADNLVITTEMSDGSLLSLQYLADGDKAFDKETIYLISEGSVFTIHDWRSGLAMRGGRRRQIRHSGRGHSREVAAFLRAVRVGDVSPVPLGEAVAASAVSLAAVESLRRGLPVDMDEFIEFE